MLTNAPHVSILTPEEQWPMLPNLDVNFAHLQSSKTGYEPTWSGERTDRGYRISIRAG